MKTIPLSQGKVALVSDRDYQLVAQFKWSAYKTHGTWYAARNVSGSSMLMHRLITGFPPFKLDHRNGNGLDNRRNNLRPASRSLNAANAKTPITNTSGLKGVSFSARHKGWRSFVKVNQQTINLGGYADKELAHLVYLAAALFYFGDYARGN